MHRKPLTVPWKSVGLAVLCLLALNGCATVDKPPSAPSPAANASPAPEDYPMWSRAMGWLLTPFTSGASGTMRF
jgi:hypothetical protein